MVGSQSHSTWQPSLTSLCCAALRKSELLTHASSPSISRELYPSEEGATDPVPQAHPCPNVRKYRLICMNGSESKVSRRGWGMTRHEDTFGGKAGKFMEFVMVGV